ncbi:MAG: hypothetical protein HOW73_10545 [Polyangiaceae bacterium]|nr:hypothetical protein [Polyangiaceae bacterium]
MRIARLLLRSSARPRVALERDGVLYDVETLERELGQAVPIPGDPWDFHTRVVALGCAGLAELDRKLLQGQRPSSARIGETGFAMLAPVDTERAAYVHVRPGARELARSLHVGHAPSIAGNDALVDLPEGDAKPTFELGIGVLVGDELRSATRAEAKQAIVGCAIVVDWSTSAPTHLRPAAGLRVQLGPVLVPSMALGNIAALRLSARVGEREVAIGSLVDDRATVEDVLVGVSHEVTLRAGDLVGIGPIARGSSEALGLPLAMHERLTVSMERVGTLRGSAVPRR